MTAFPLLRDHVQDARTLKVAEAAERFRHLRDVVSVDGTEIPEAQGLEHGAAGHAHQVGLRVHDPALDPVAELAFPQAVPDMALDLIIRIRSGDAKEVIVQAARSLVNGHVVVVQDHEKVRLRGTGVVQTLPGEPPREGTVADEGHRALLGAGEAGRLGKAEGRRDGRGGVPGAERVVRALVPLGEAADAVAGAVPLERVAPPGQDLVGVGLVPDVEDELVLGRVEHGVQAHDELHGAQARSQMPRILRAALNHILTDLRAQLLELRGAEFPDIRRTIYLLQ